MSPWAAAGAVASGAAIGALLRWRFSLWLNPLTPLLPLGTWVVNALGGLAIGMALAWLAAKPGAQEVARLFLVTGLLGGLTTFSTFSAESLMLIQQGRLAWALAHTLAHVLASLGAAALGYWLARTLGLAIAP